VRGSSPRRGADFSLHLPQSGGGMEFFVRKVGESSARYGRPQRVGALEAESARPARSGGCWSNSGGWLFLRGGWEHERRDEGEARRRPRARRQTELESTN